MGIDIKHNTLVKAKRNFSKSKNVYLTLLVKLYRFLIRRTGSRFCKVILRRLVTTKQNKAPVSTSKLAVFLENRSKGKGENKILVVVGKVTNDPRFLNLPKLTVVALRFTAAARASIKAAGGKTLTFDQFALQRPTGANTILVRGEKNARESFKHFGAPGVPHSTTKPYTISKGRKFEQARGRRSSRGFKV